MAYNTQYTANFTNELSQEVVVYLQQKDSAPVAEPPNYPVADLSIRCGSDESESYACIIGREMELSIFTEEGDDITWETFLTASSDEWKVIVEVDGKFFFHGFLNAEEGEAPFQDKPYEVVLRATDRIGLLKDTPLTDINGDKFVGFFYLIEFIAGALIKTGLDLPIRIYSSYFHSAFLNKGDSLNYDMFRQAKLNARTFIKDSNSFVSCYEALKILFDGSFSVKYHNGYWQIKALAERQYLAGSNYYVDYEYDGTNATGAIDSENYAEVGKNDLIYPHEAVIIKSQIPAKSVKHRYAYTVPPDLVNNQKLQQFGAFIAPLSGVGYSAYELYGWSKYQNPSPTTVDFTGLTSYGGTKKAYIKIEVDAFNTQVDRYYVIEKDASINDYGKLGLMIRHDNDDFFIEAGDRISPSVTTRLKNTEAGLDTFNFATLLLLKDGTDGSQVSHWYSLNAQGAWVNFPDGTDPWTPSSFAIYPGTTDRDDTEWFTYTAESDPAPVTGKLYLFLHAGSADISSTNEVHIKDITFDSSLFIRGSRFNMKADYWITSADNSFNDADSKEVFISDSPKRIVKGGLWGMISGNLTLLDPSWYRWPNTSESYHFKELVNIGKWNHKYRRFRQIEGAFTSIMYRPQNDPTVNNPLSFDIPYRFTELGRDFVLMTPLEMNLVTGIINAKFAEVKYAAPDGEDLGDTHEFGYEF